MATLESNTYEVVILLPAKDEELTIQESIIRFNKCLPDANIIVIDNNSKDSTAKIARQVMEEFGVDGRVIMEHRAGKGNAIWKGLKAVNASVYVMCDSDCTYPIEDVYRIVDPIAPGRADVYKVFKG